MKKFFTLMILSAFVAVSAFADDSSLGDVKWSIKDGAKINPAKTITLTFPNATGFEFGSTVEIACNLYAADEAPSEDNAFDGIEGTIIDGVAFILPDFEVVESTKYILKVTSILVNGVEVIGDTVYTLNFTTRGADRRMSWTFSIDEASAAEIAASVKNDARTGEFWLDVNGNASDRSTSKDDVRFYSVSRNWEPLMVNATTELPMTEDLLFKFGDKKLYVGNTASGKTSYKDEIVFNANDLYVQIPDLKEGDIVTFNARRATTSSSTKRTYIAQTDGMAIALSGVESSRGVVDSVQLAPNNNFADYKFQITQDGDVNFAISQAWVSSINIEEAKPIVDVNYSIVAVAADDETKVLKTIKETTLGKTNDAVTVNYSYWLKDEEGYLYTHGSKGTPFTETFYLDSNDTIFAIKYTKTETTGVVYVSEAEEWFDEENLESPIQLCTNENSAIRSSNGKAAYCAAEEGYQLTTLPAGKYKIKAVLFDANKTASYMPTFMVGSEEVTLSATATNFAEVESGVIEITEESPVILKQSGNDKQGIDIIAIYATDEMPEPDFQLGDANGDGEITMADANMVVNYFLAEDKDSIDNFHFEAADANEDGDITMADANKIVNIFLGTDSVVE